MRVHREGDLQIDQDLEFERRQWAAQNVAYGLWALLLAAAIAGLLGQGPASKAVARTPGGVLTVDYERFVRAQAECVLRVTVASAPGQARPALWIDSGYLGHVRLCDVFPAPAAVRQGARAVFTFDRGTQEVKLRTRVEKFGVLTGRLGLVGGPAVDLWQLSYP